MSILKFDFFPNRLNCDAFYDVEYSSKFFLCRKSDEEGAHYFIYDDEEDEEILFLDFDFDVNEEKNRCLSLNDVLLVFIKYSPKEDKYYNYTYDVLEGIYFIYEEEYNGMQSDGSLVLTTNIWGEKAVVPKQTKPIFTGL